MNKILGLAALLSALGAFTPLHAAPYDTPPTWGGDLASRPRLTGNWGGVPANLSWLLPTIEPDTGLQEFTYTQFLSQHSGLFLGKINSLAPTNVFHGDYRTGLQIISPALNKALDSKGNLKDLDTTYVAGVRVGIRF